jgi:hypothetical protein
MPGGRCSSCRPRVTEKRHSDRPLVTQYGMLQNRDFEAPQVTVGSEAAS